MLSAQFDKAAGPDKFEVLRSEVKGEMKETRKELNELKKLLDEVLK